MIKQEVQVEFVGVAGAKRLHGYGWEPSESAFIEAIVDGQRYRIELGDFHDGKTQRRGIHIIAVSKIFCETTSINACSVWVEPST
jgi:hypothetical protein